MASPPKFTETNRALRGSRITSFYPVKTLPPLASLDSAFQLQEYISLLIRLDVHDVDLIVAVPGKAAKSDGESTSPVDSATEDPSKAEEKEVTVDEACWIYEQLRRLAQDLSHPLITMLQQECTRSSCPEMKAGEWLYLCVAHGNDGAMEQCCAIDYILHTLDSATALLNSPRAFPSRLSIPQTSHRHFSSLARRLGRIFAHAYFHHREAFEQAEVESSLYARFLALTSKFDLVPAEFLVIPPRLTLTEGRGGGRDQDVRPPRLLGAAIDPQGERERDHHERQTRLSDDFGQAWSERGKSTSPPGLSQSSAAPGDGSESPRKMGRHRTDTMVFSEGFNIAEQLAKQEAEASAAVSTSATSIEVINSPKLIPPADERASASQDEVAAQVEAVPLDLPVTPAVEAAPSTVGLLPVSADGYSMPLTDEEPSVIEPTTKPEEQESTEQAAAPIDIPEETQEEDTSPAPVKDVGAENEDEKAAQEGPSVAEKEEVVADPSLDSTTEPASVSKPTLSESPAPVETTSGPEHVQEAGLSVDDESVPPAKEEDNDDVKKVVPEISFAEIAKVSEPEKIHKPLEDSEAEEKKANGEAKPPGTAPVVEEAEKPSTSEETEDLPKSMSKDAIPTTDVDEKQETVVDVLEAKAGDGVDVQAATVMTGEEDNISEEILDNKPVTKASSLSEDQAAPPPSSTETA